MFWCLLSMTNDNVYNSHWELKEAAFEVIDGRHDISVRYTRILSFSKQLAFTNIWLVSAETETMKMFHSMIENESC